MAGGYRTPLEFALMAALAVVVARTQGTAIVDPARFFTPAIESPVEAFVARVRARDVFSGVAAAAERLYDNLFLAAYPRVPKA